MKLYGSHNNFNEMFPQEISDPGKSSFLSKTILNFKDSVMQLKKSHAALVTKNGMNFPHS